MKKLNSNRKNFEQFSEYGSNEFEEYLMNYLMNSWLDVFIFIAIVFMYKLCTSYQLLTFSILLYTLLNSAVILLLYTQITNSNRILFFATIFNSRINEIKRSPDIPSTLTIRYSIFAFIEGDNNQKLE